MTKIKFIVPALFLAVSASAFAAAPAVKTVDALTVSEEAMPAPIVNEKTTIGRLSQKQLQLYELELDAKIAETKQKTMGGSSKASSAPSMPAASVPLPPISVRAINNASMEANYEVTAVYGRTNDLQAEVTVDGRTFNVKKGSMSIPGWRVDSVSSDHVALSNSKRTKNVYLSAQAPTTVGQTATTSATNGNASPMSAIGPYGAPAPMAMPPVPTNQ